MLNSEYLANSRRWASFTVWGAGRDARQFVGLLSEGARRRIKAMCDVDPKKIGTQFTFFAGTKVQILTLRTHT